MFIKKDKLISELKKTNFKTFSLQGIVDIWKIWLSTKTVRVSPAGNRTPVSRVTGGGYSPLYYQGCHTVKLVRRVNNMLLTDGFISI